MNDYLKTLIFLLITVWSAVVPLKSQAHLSSGVDIEKDNYLIDIGWEPDPILADQKATLAVNLVDKETKQPIEFDKLFLRFNRDETIIAAMKLTQELPGNVTLDFTFPQAGGYNLLTRFFKNEQIMAEGKIKINISSQYFDQAQLADSNLNQQIKDIIKKQPLIILIIIFWSFTWKGLALWRAVALQQKVWFVVLLVINTLGLLEIIYLIITRHKFLDAPNLNDKI